MAPWSLISPASRGIGFALAREVLRTTNAPVVATARKDLSETKKKLLDGLHVDERRLTLLKVNVLDEHTIAEAAESCKAKFDPRTHHLHLAFVIPGILFPEKSPAQIDAVNALLTFRTNTLGPMLMLKHFEQFLPKKRTVIRDNTDGPNDTFKNLPAVPTTAIMSARVGSISDNRLGGWYSYRASKAGVNQLVKTFDHHLKAVSGENAMAVGLHPGTVKTELSQEFWKNVDKEKLFEKEWVADRLLEVVRGLGVEARGRCWDWDGKEVPP